MNKLAALALLLASCLPEAPYLTERKVGDLSRHWASSGGSATKVLTVHNPLGRRASVDVWCYGSPFGGQPERTFRLGPGGEESVLIEVPVRYQVGEACVVTGAR